MRPKNEIQLRRPSLNFPTKMESRERYQQIIFRAMHFIKLFALVVLLAAGCAPSFKYSNRFNQSSIQDIERKYQRLFDVENEVTPSFVVTVLNNAKYIRQGSPDYHPPGMISIYHDLQYMIQCSLAGGDEAQISMRRHLIKKIGVVSSLIAAPRSEDVRLYISPPDKFAFTLAEIQKIYGHDSPKYSSLASIIKNEPAGQPKATP